jgi:hypothetical protein
MQSMADDTGRRPSANCGTGIRLRKFGTQEGEEDLATDLTDGADKIQKRAGVLDRGEVIGNG